MPGTPRNLEPDLLRSFLAVAETESFTAAARRLNRTQSAVSLQIRRLEESLGQALFERTTRRLGLTQAGEKLMGYARRLLQLNDLAWQDLTAPAVEGRVTLGIPDDYGFYLPQILAHFSQLYPRVDLEVHCDLSVELVRHVQQGDIDLALVTRQPRSPGGEELLREPLVWAGPSGHSVAERDPLPLALFSQGTCVFRDQGLQALEAAGRRWRVAYTSQSLAGLRAAVRAGLAVTVVTRSMLGGDLVAVGASAGLPALPSVAITLHRAPGRPSTAVQRLAALMRENLGQAPQSAGAGAGEASLLTAPAVT